MKREGKGGDERTRYSESGREGKEKKTEGKTKIKKIEDRKNM